MKKRICLALLFIFLSPLTIPLYEVASFLRSPSLNSPPVAKELFTADTRLKAHTAALKHPTVKAFSDDTGEVFLIKQIRYDSLIKKWESTFALAHEYFILHAIQDIPQVSHLIGKIDSDAFSIRYIPRFQNISFNKEEVDTIKAHLIKVLKNLHERGIYHLDLRCRDHIIISESLLPHLIDFGKAVYLPSFLNRWIGGLFAYEDRLLMLTAIFLMNPDSLTKKEMIDLATFYKRKTYLSKRHVPLLERIEKQRIRMED